MHQKTGRFRLQTFLKVSGRKLCPNNISGPPTFAKKSGRKCPNVQFENGIPATRSKIDLELLMRAP